MHSVFNPTVALTLLFIGTSHGQNLNSNIVGCAVIPCPDDSAGNAKCTVIDKTFPNVGLARIPVTSQVLTGLSWTEGVAVNETNGNRTFEKTFYFGTPPKANLTGTGACAIFFNQVSKKVSFASSNVEEAQGTCQDAMNAQCVTALVARAEKVDITGLGNVEACAKLENSFKETVDSACTVFADGDKWNAIIVKPLTGTGAAVPITSSQNSTSNCWPITPREYDLSLVTSVQAAGDFSVETASTNFYGITPILTLFYPGNGSLITKAEAQMTCMKTVGPSASKNETKSDNDNSEDKGSAGVIRGPSVTILVTAMAVLALTIV
ncbi:hypothetical protein BKA65DRAFT_64303 [Rhexocercosporidium sp. MPI-PUGE-AT-0058]|nr:hypothetical protein BKA65DRAFT_64303 [Rhexocercosporidium sp. MPI-PUGE-AT-0058]